ncbi:hypothetical protein OG912_18335 [Streptomyces sp. NBC_00464]
MLDDDVLIQGIRAPVLGACADSRDRVDGRLALDHLTEDGVPPPLNV